MTRVLSILRDSRGAVALEMALVLPVLLVLLTGSVDIVRYVLADQRAVVATRTVVDLVARAGAPVTATTLGDMARAGSLVFDPYGATALSGRIYSVVFDAQGAASVAGSYPVNGGPSAANAEALAIAAGLGRNGDSVVVFISSVPFKPAFVQPFVGTVVLKNVSVARPRKGKPIVFTP